MEKGLYSPRWPTEVMNLFIHIIKKEICVIDYELQPLKLTSDLCEWFSWSIQNFYIVSKCVKFGKFLDKCALKTSMKRNVPRHFQLW